MKLKITCREASFLIIKSEEQRLSYHEKIRIQLHLLICKFCRLFKHQNKILNKALSSKNGDEFLTDKEKEKLRKLIS